MLTERLNIFDDPLFFKAYLDFRKKDAGFNAAIEWPAMLQALPRASGLRALDLGCGTGRLCRALSTRGAKNVIGVDCSRNMISLARATSQRHFAVVEYREDFIEDCRFKASSFDIIVSSMALHYISDIQTIFSRIARWLKKNGSFVFSIEHPIYTANTGGWIKNDTTHPIWPIERYSDEGARCYQWLGFDVVKYHRRLETILAAVIESKLTIHRIAEPQAHVTSRQCRQGLRDENNRPAFLLVQAKRKA